MNPPVWVRMERTLANDAAPIYMVLTDTTGKRATIESEAADATTIGSWTRISAAPGDLNVNLSQIESITIGVSGANVEGKIFVDAIRTARPFVTPWAVPFPCILTIGAVPMGAALFFKLHIAYGEGRMVSAVLSIYEPAYRET